MRLSNNRYEYIKALIVSIIIKETSSVSNIANHF